jgi:anhydro-N-acetylmuramic acid kinase
MIYRVIGIMSGSSLDGLDIVYTTLEEQSGKWTYQIIASDCIAFDAVLKSELHNAAQLEVPEYLLLHTRFGRFIGEQINRFIQNNELEHKVHFIASHGHTVFHSPSKFTSVQIGDGATISAVTGLPVISDLRSMDVALGGQGAPIVPIGDQLLFGDYDYWLNIGGIANMTARSNDRLVAFDICPANQMLNLLAQQLGQDYDKDGAIAARGRLLFDVLSQLNEQAYYRLPPPKSLSNEAAIALAFPHLLESPHDIPDLLHTAVVHIADEVCSAVRLFPVLHERPRMLITGGGAFNGFLVEKIKEQLLPLNVSVVVPDNNTVMYKEALIMALIGTLRWREEVNILKEVTGALQSSIGGALWMSC